MEEEDTYEKKIESKLQFEGDRMVHYLLWEKLLVWNVRLVVFVKFKFYLSVHNLESFFPAQDQLELPVTMWEIKWPNLSAPVIIIQLNETSLNKKNNLKMTEL